MQQAEFGLPFIGDIFCSDVGISMQESISEVGEFMFIFLKEEKSFTNK